MTDSPRPIPLAARMGLTQIQNAQAQQLTYEDGRESEWIVSLYGEELYRLPDYVTVNDTFRIRDVVQAMMERAYDEGAKYQETVAKAQVKIIQQNGQEQLNALLAENERLSEIINATHGET